MQATDRLTVRGALDITVRRQGVIIERIAMPNMILEAARTAMAALIAGDGAGKHIAEIGVGTNGDGPAPGDTGLTGAFTKPVSGFAYPAAGEVRFDWRLETTEANGLSIREFGLITADGTLFARKTRAAIEKADDISLDGSWTIIF